MRWLREQKEREKRIREPSLGQRLINAYWDNYLGYRLGAENELYEIALIVTEEHESSYGVKANDETMAKGETQEYGR